MWTLFLPSFQHMPLIFGESSTSVYEAQIISQFVLHSSSSSLVVAACGSSHKCVQVL
jgi:hypothetical protein